MKTLSDLIDEGIHVRREAVRVIVTPACASRALAVNTGNRFVRLSNLDYLSNLIKIGEWRDDHNHGITFSDKGRLIDGQHRLMAVVKASRPVIMRVDTGTDDDLRQHFDTGAARTMFDRVDFSDNRSLNKKVTEVISAWLRMKVQCARKMPISVVQAAYAQWSDEATYIGQFIMSNQKKETSKRVIRSSVLAAIMEVMRKDREFGIEFLNSVIFPDGEIQPARALREWMLKNVSRCGFQQEMLQYRVTWSAIESALAGRDVKYLRPLGREMATIGYPLNRKEGE